MAAFETAEIPVHRSRDSLWIGEARPQGVLTQSIAVDGGIIVLVVDDLGRVPFAAIDDHARASWWISHVFGPDVAEVVARIDDDPGLGQLTARAEPGVLAAGALRFGVGLWLHRWWPSKDRIGVPELTERAERLLETDLGVLAWFTEDLFAGKDMARGFLEENVQFVREYAESSSKREHPLAALRAVIESVPLDDQTFDSLSSTERALSEQWVPTEDEVSGFFDTESTGLTRSLGGGLVAGIDGGLLGSTRLQAAGSRGDGEATRIVREARSTVEWGRVPARVLGAAENNVSWSIEVALESGAATFSATVPLGDRPTLDSLYAAVRRGGDRFPEVLAELLPDPWVPGHLTAASPIDVPGADDEFEVTIIGDGHHVDEVARTPDERQAIADVVTGLATLETTADSDLPPFAADPHLPWFVLPDE